MKEQEKTRGRDCDAGLKHDPASDQLQEGKQRTLQAVVKECARNPHDYLRWGLCLINHVFVVVVGCYSS